MWKVGDILLRTCSHHKNAVVLENGKVLFYGDSDYSVGSYQPQPYDFISNYELLVNVSDVPDFEEIKKIFASGDKNAGYFATTMLRSYNKNLKLEEDETNLAK